MAAARLPRGTRIEPVALGYKIERAKKERLDAIASNAQVSAAVLIEHMIDRLELTDQGVPVWWTPLPRDEELPITGT
jgi:hypothetical protein